MKREETDKHWMPKWIPWWELRSSESGFEVFDCSAKSIIFESRDPNLVRQFYAAPMVYRAAAALLEVNRRRELAPQFVSRRRVELFEEVLEDMIAFADGKEIPLFVDEPEIHIEPLHESANEKERAAHHILLLLAADPIYGSRRSPSNPWHVAMVRRGLEHFFLNAVNWDEDEFIPYEDILERH